MTRRANQRHRRELRREEAEVRQAARDARSDERQLGVLETRPGASAKETIRLHERINKRQERSNS